MSNNFIEDYEEDGQLSDLHKIEKLLAQEAIAFAEWIDGQGYQCHLHTDDGEKFWNKYDKGNFTTEHLYQLYKQR